METGTDGRFYDWHYDYNHNGMLEMNELMDYEDITFGSMIPAIRLGEGASERLIMDGMHWVGLFVGSWVPV